MDLSKYTQVKYRQVNVNRYQVSGLDMQGKRVLIGFVDSIPKQEPVKKHIPKEETK